MFGSLSISASGLAAQRTRLEVASANLANKDAVYDAQGRYNPFRRRIAILSAGDPASGNGMGVHVQQIQQDRSPLRKVHDPNHPLADANGYVNYPNVDPAFEMIDALEASRAYEANIAAAEATKSMLQSSLRLLA